MSDRESKLLLDALNNLRALGVGASDAPNVIAIGQASTGKSSILKALSECFLGDACTRAATEAGAHRADESTTRAEILFAESWMLPSKAAQRGNSDNLKGKGKDVNDMVWALAAEPHTIILAVLAADRPLDLQQDTLDRAKQYDENGDRTIGVITKPDCAFPGSDNERQYIALTQGRDQLRSLPLGWYVVQNPSSSDVKTTNRGAESLCSRVAGLLLDRVKPALPRVIDDIKSELSARQQALDRLGPPRNSPEEIRRYMLGVAAQYERLARDAVAGRYNDAFFLEANESNAASAARKLRSILAHTNRAFEAAMYKKGAKYELDELDETTMSASITDEDLVFDRFKDLPDPAPHSELVEKLRCMALSSRGRELPGSSNPEVMSMLFREQTQPWLNIAQEYLHNVLSMVNTFVDQLIIHVVGGDKDANSSMTESILRGYVDPFFVGKHDALEAKLQELLRPYVEGYAVPLERHFHASMTQRAPSAEDVIEKMAIFYEMSLQTFVSNVMNLAVESCLVLDLPTILDVTTVAAMTDDKLHELAAESDLAKQKRARLQHEIETLREALQTCRKHKPREFKELPAALVAQSWASSPQMNALPDITVDNQAQVPGTTGTSQVTDTVEAKPVPSRDIGNSTTVAINPPRNPPSSFSSPPPPFDFNKPPAKALFGTTAGSGATPAQQTKTESVSAGLFGTAPSSKPLFGSVQTQAASSSPTPPSIFDVRAAQQPKIEHAASSLFGSKPPLNRPLLDLNHASSRFSSVALHVRSFDSVFSLLPIMVAVAAYNAINPVCASNTCLQQVAGLLDNNPVVYYEACTSVFGAPATSTFTVDSLVSTATETQAETWTDIFIVFTTNTQTEIDTVTAWEPLSATASETSTIIVTETATVTVPAEGNTVLKARNPAPYQRKKRACTQRTSTVPSTPADITSTSIPPAVPTNCANLDEFSSACSCITAVSDAYVTTVTVTEVTSTGTWEIEWITETETSTTTTFVATTTELTTSTTTVTETETASPIILQGYWEFEGLNKYLSPKAFDGTATVGNTIPGPNVNIGIPSTGGQPFLVSQPHRKFYALRAKSPNIDIPDLSFPGDYVSDMDAPVFCQVNQDRGITCNIPGTEYSQFLVCSIYFRAAKPSFSDSICKEAIVRLVEQ
ncbi:hypothetical protein VTJ49DRAFT_1565 [Mycothermus thermophilus]|uniref:GED domain-containing protein n=1 Tax=Humicola insolens TaxID=85995 RepID=A0ABR3VNR6_HUMIN